jgi:lipopolysaccharide/colanic/teichoic acid biosynthesis glycosyltransferase
MSKLARGTGTVRIKHTLDRVLAVLALVALLPVLAAIGLWILLESGKPILFEQRRVGKNGREFDMLKFRTMDAGPNLSADPHGHLPDDPRITRSGRFLRATSLDELPQLLNVVRGDMSLVGPRADIVEQVANYTESDRRRLTVKPGITGWAQINGRDSIPWPKRFELDAWYVDNWSLLLDAKIVVETAMQIFRERPEPVVDDMNIERAKARNSS